MVISWSIWHHGCALITSWRAICLESTHNAGHSALHIQQLYSFLFWQPLCVQWKWYIILKELWHHLQSCSIEMEFQVVMLMYSGCKVWVKKKLHTSKNWLLIKVPQFLPNLYDTWSKLSPHELIILTKFHKDWAKIMEFLLIVNFWMCAGFFTQTLVK